MRSFAALYINVCYAKQLLHIDRIRDSIFSGFARAPNDETGYRGEDAQRRRTSQLNDDMREHGSGDATRAPPASQNAVRQPAFERALRCFGAVKK
ncbi:hypothetical protein B6V72_18865 [Thioclava sp. F34-6]|uniref:hypothetical protein n=1 Tax=Thioclava sp. F34-6 TaxID=1973003 RepID=UPI000B54305D|nr:hypothetical protein [Thioclava sp. F34-6]OWY07595.1 hypothetical protein B6V72_18865 [Thioclava sp. F34-6]